MCACGGSPCVTELQSVSEQIHNRLDQFFDKNLTFSTWTLTEVVLLYNTRVFSFLLSFYCKEDLK